MKWRKRDGVEVPLSELTDAHLANAIRYTERRSRTLDGNEQSRRMVLARLIEEQERRRKAAEDAPC